MTTLWNPQLQEIASMDDATVQSFLAAHALVARKDPAGETIAYEQALDELITGLSEDQAATVVRRSRRGLSLQQIVKAELSAGKVVVVEPSNEMFAEYYTVKGFIETMERIRQSLAKARFVVPPGRYGSRLLAVFGGSGEGMSNG